MFLYHSITLFADHKNRYQSALAEPVFKLCGLTLGKVKYYTTFWIHGTSFHGIENVKEKIQKIVLSRDHMT